MKNFNEFEQWFINTAINSAVEEAEKEVLKDQNNGKRLIYAPGFFTMQGKDIKDKVAELTIVQKFDSYDEEE